MFILIIGVLIIFCILLFICYSYMQNQRSKYVSQMYKEFKEQYGANAKVAMGFSQTNVFSKAMTLMIAVNPEDHRVIDAWAVTDNDMEIEGRTCAEYLGIDINKYAEDVRKICELEEKLLTKIPVWKLMNRGDKESAKLCHDTLLEEK